MDPLNPIVGQFVFDGTEFLTYAVDLPPGACQGMLPTREGFEEACKELVAAQAAWGLKAGIPDQEITDLTTANERVARIDVFLPALMKAVEMLTETRYMLDDKRQRIVMDAAQAVDRRSGKVPDLNAKYEKTREYRSAIAKKGLKTKEKKAEQQQAGGNGVQQQPQQPPQAPPAP
jgi:hypothetical protein